MRKIKWFFGILFAVAIMFAGCEKNGDLFDSAPNGELKKGKINNPVSTVVSAALNYATPDGFNGEMPVCNSQTYELIGGRTIDVGDVVIGNDNEYLYISIYCKDGFQDVKENVKIWLGTSIDEFEGKRPVSGKFPYKFTVTEGLELNLKFSFVELGITCETPEVHAVIHVDAVVITDDITTEETAFAGNYGEIKTGSAWWYSVVFSPKCCVYEPPIDNPCTEKNETAFGGDFGYNIMNAGAWWYHFDANGNATQSIWAGQTILIGTVTYDSNQGTLTINLFDNARLQDVGDAVKIQGYNDGDLPTTRQPAGQYKTYKGNSLVINVPAYDYYVIHLDTWVCR